MKKLLLSVASIAVLVIAAVLILTLKKTPVQPVQTAVAPAPMLSAPSSTLVLASDIAWSYKAGKAGNGMILPQTAVTLTVKGRSYGVGSYDGTCSPVATLVPGELSGIQCYYAGGGTELGVFSDNGKVVLKKGDIDEGSDETAPFRGNFQTIQEFSF